MNKHLQVFCSNSIEFPKNIFKPKSVNSTVYICLLNIKFVLVKVLFTYVFLKIS